MVGTEKCVSDDSAQRIQNRAKRVGGARRKNKKASREKENSGKRNKNTPAEGWIDQALQRAAAAVGGVRDVE
jgi:hypothetical protein